MAPDVPKGVSRWNVIALILLTAFLSSCRHRGEVAKPIVTVLAAASTADAVTEVGERFRDETGVEVRVSPGPSNGLARQVENGAPADVFLSASTEWADAVRNHAVAMRTLLTNRLVLVVPKGNPAGVMTPDDLASEQVHTVALAGEKVPAGKYADAALNAIGLRSRLDDAGKIVRGHDVRVTLGFIERREADAGIVYATDAVASDLVEVVHAFDPDSHGPIIYPAVLLKHGPAGEVGRQFFEYLFSPAARDVFRRYGFASAAEGQSP